MAAGFGRPVAHLRLHTDAPAARLAEGLDAQAFTAGSHIFFASDRSPGDLGLLAHEVAHALQQPAGVPTGALPVGAPGGAGERAADQAAEAIVSGGSARAGAHTPAQIARKERGLLSWAWDKVEDPEAFIEDVVAHPFDATIAAAASEFSTGVKQDLSDVAGLGSDALGAMRQNATNIREGGDAVEAWLVEQQKQVAASNYADAEQHADTPLLGPLLKANAWMADQGGQVGTGIAGGAVTLATGILGAGTNPVDTALGLFKLGGEVGNATNPLLYASSAGSKYVATGDSSALNPLAKGTALSGAWDALSKPYVRAIDDGRYSEAGGRLFFDVASMLIGSGGSNAAARGSKAAPIVRTGSKVDVLANTLPAGADLAKTLPAGADLAKTLPAGGDLAKTLPAGADLATTAPGRPMPTMVLPETPAFSPIRAQQYLKLSEWFDDFWRPEQMKPVPSVPKPVGLDDVAAAAQARRPIITHLSESFHQTIWESAGGAGKAPPAFRNNEVLFVDYERLPAAEKQAVDASKNAIGPSTW